MNVQSEERAVGWTAADIPDQAGRTAVVTGANGGLGLETTRALAAAGAHVVMAARNQDKAAEAVADIRRGAPDASLEVVPLDLGSLASVREAAGRILASDERIDILVNNAGIMGIPERRTADGFEMQFGVNHLGHYALTALLMPALLRADAARIVTVTSTAHHMGRAVDPANPHLEGRYGPWRAYGQAKLANFHFGLGLQRRLAAAGAPAEKGGEFLRRGFRNEGGAFSKADPAADRHGQSDRPPVGGLGARDRAEDRRPRRPDGAAGFRLASGRPESGEAARRLVECLHLDRLRVGERRDEQLCDPIPRCDLEGLGGVCVQEQHPQLTPVAAVDQARRVGKRDPLAWRPARARKHQPRVVVG